ncbi:MAG: hypothetical protein JNL02_06150 [Saprospiraceae bacterium]|nr:hypothetical protein [Saprospiraceae bacterium]
MNFRTTLSLLLLLGGFGLFPVFSGAQSLTDGIFMNKKFLCAGVFYGHDAWDEYWEGTLLRTNGNIGTVTTQNVLLGLNYGITDRLNAVVMAPYVWTEASAGTLAGQSGIQDLTLGLKYNVVAFNGLGGRMSVQAVAGGSLPLTDYVADHLPLSIGLQSKTLFGRGILHYAAENNLTFLLSGTYTLRSNIEIDRESYYTTEQIYSNEVEMPDAAQLYFRGGYYSFRWGAELTASHNMTLGGFDIRRQDMPFPSNNMDLTRVGVEAFYRFSFLGDLQLLGQVNQTVAGRNMGKSLGWTLGLTKFINFNKD